MSQTFKKLKELFLKNVEEEKKQLQEINSDLERILELSNKLDNAYAKKIQTAFKEYKTKKQEKLVENFSKKLASTKISKAYKDKLLLAQLNKLIGDQLCSITGGQEKYRENIKDLLNKNGTPEKLSNMYFYYCKFGKKILGYYEKAKPEFKSIIKEIVGCVFVNTSFKSTNFNNIKFKNTRFLNIANYKHASNKYYSFLERNNAYRSIKKTHKSDDNLEFDNAGLNLSTFDNCQFFNIQFIKNVFGLNENLDPIFYECKFINCIIIFPLLIDNTKKPTEIGKIDNNNKILYPSIKSILSIEKNGQLNHDRYFLEIIPNMIIEKTEFINSDFLSEKDLTIEAYLYKNCTFNTTLFTNVKFVKNNFVNCTFNNVTFNNCNFLNVYFRKCKFYNCIFKNPYFGNTGLTEFSNCTIIGCEFNSGVWHNWLHPTCTTIIDSSTIINECKFINLALPGYKFNNNSEYDTRQENDILMDMRKNDFICCSLIGTNFDNCNLEGSKFAARTTCISYFNWFGSIYKLNTSEPKFGKNKSKEFEKLCGNKENYNKFLLEFQGSKKQNKLDRLGIQQYLRMRYNEYSSLNIDVNKLREAETNIEPYDYFNVPTYGFFQIIPATSMFNSNIKNCNFQSIDGFQSFDFTQVMKNEKGNPDLTATNLTHVRLENANFNGCNLIGTIFQVADIKGADFRNTIVNNNTDFENTMNVELVPHQIDGENGRRHVEGSKNTDTGRGLEFSDLQQQANETHARSQHVIDSRDKFESLLDNMGLPKDTNILTTMKSYLLDVQHIPLDIIEFKIIPNSEEKIIDFLNKLVVIYNKILDSERDLPEGEDKNYIRKYFANAICNYVSYRLKYDDKESENLYNDFKPLINEEFLKILLSFKRDSNRQKWCWLQLVTLSLKFLISNTEMYIYMFMQYYFNEVFNAHGKGSKSCTLGMVERLVLIHSQASEGYLMTLKMDSNELKNLSSIINSIKKYNPANESVKDSKISKEFIEKFNNPDDIQVYHHKYIYNKLINILKPNSELAENKEEDLGFDFDFNISKEMRDKCSKYIKDSIDEGEISTIDQICEVFVKSMQKLIIHNNGVSQEKLLFYLNEAKPKLRDLFVKKLDAIKEHLETTEIEFLKMDIVIMCGEEFTTEDISKYFDPDLDIMGGAKRKKKVKSRKAKGLASRSKTIVKRTRTVTSIKKEKLYNLLEKALIKKLASLNYDKFKELFNKKYSTTKMHVVENIDNGEIAKEKSKKQSLVSKSRKALSLRSRSKSKSRTSSKSRFTRRTKSLPNLTIHSKSQTKLSISQDYPYQAFSLKNMTIQDKQYKEIIKANYIKMINNYKERITNKTFTKSIKESIKLQEKVESKKQKSLTKTLKRLSKSKSPTGIMELV